LSETLAVDSSEVEAIDILTAPKFGDYWTPYEALFDILRDKPCPAPILCTSLI